MLIVLSPAKTLDLEPSQLSAFSMPRMMDDGQQLVDLLKQKTVEDLKSLMKVSDKLARLNVQRYQSFELPFTTNNAKQALLTFQGDVYTGLKADTFSAQDMEFAQDHLRVLSGLYGVLRPLDLMQAYRLEMGTPLPNTNGKNLYDFWDDRITRVLNEDLKAADTNILLNLASKEYFRAVKPDQLQGKVLTIHFKEYRNEQLKVISFNAKKARGAMARQVIQQRITKPEGLKKLEVEGYWFRPDLSTSDEFTFVKEPEKAIG
jgi:cytoplasmic iron level regulating protein YaaA (DUF328/UPF0246 family)